MVDTSMSINEPWSSFAHSWCEAVQYRWWYLNVESPPKAQSKAGLFSVCCASKDEHERKVQRRIYNLLFDTRHILSELKFCFSQRTLFKLSCKTIWWQQTLSAGSVAACWTSVLADCPFPVGIFISFELCSLRPLQPTLANSIQWSHPPHSAGLGASKRLFRPCSSTWVACSSSILHRDEVGKWWGTGVPTPNQASLNEQSKRDIDLRTHSAIAVS